MRALLIAVGSRGDAEPFCSLAAAFAEAGNSVELFLQKDLVHLAPPSSQVSCHELPFTQTDFYRYASSPSHGVDHPNPRVKFVGAVADIILELVLPCFDQVLSIAENSRVHTVVASSLARQLAMAIADHRNIPLYLIQLQPLVPTRDFPHHSQTDKCVEAITGNTTPSQENLESYIELERFQYDFVKDGLEKVNGRSMKDFDDVLAALMGDSKSNIYMVNAFSNHLIPKCTAGEKVLHIGALADAYVPKDWNPPESLLTFLNSTDERPVCVGYGSMPFDAIHVIVAALEELKRPAVLVGSCMLDIDENERMKKKLYCIDSVPYAWLLPRCSMMLSHGGAGVIHATLRAGIPALVSPLIGDQFFWASLLQTTGLGVQVSSNLAALSKHEVVDSIRKAEKSIDLCNELGFAMRKDEPDGTASLVERIVLNSSSTGSEGKRRP